MEDALTKILGRATLNGKHFTHVTERDFFNVVLVFGC